MSRRRRWWSWQLWLFKYSCSSWSDIYKIHTPPQIGTTGGVDIQAVVAVVLGLNTGSEESSDRGGSGGKAGENHLEYQVYREQVSTRNDWSEEGSDDGDVEEERQAWDCREG
jgi:hypothetical protein